MSTIPDPVAAFLEGKHLAVAGVSRTPNQAANHIYRKLKGAGHEVFPVNPKASEVEGTRCYPDLASLPLSIHGVVIATPPDASVEIVRQCENQGIRRVWLHRSFGAGSVSDDAVRLCEERGIECIVGGCPLMFCEPVDIAHRCMRWWLQRRGRVAR